MIIAEIYLIICILFLAGKDASSYLLKDKLRSDNTIDLNRIKRWHRDGVVLNILFLIPLLFLIKWYILIYAFLIRLSFFDIAFNKWSGLNPYFLGSTSLVDKIFIKIFGKNGAIKKSLFFFAILIILNILQGIFLN
jgi:hypothetical protein